MATTKKPVYRRVEVIRVYIWEQLVGAVALDPRYQYYAFSFDDKFRRTGIDLSPLKMPIAGTEEVVMFTELPEATYKRLPALLADSLPDDFGNALVERYMAKRGFSSSQITTLDRLA